MSIEEDIKEVEEEIKRTPYNKATQHHIGKLKAKLARLKDSLRKKSSAKGYGFGIKKAGDATVVLVGFPSVGKSTLLGKLTHAKPAIADYEFTTIDVIPGMMEYRGVRIQLLDLPGIITGASIGRGMGREVLSIVRNSDLVLMMVDNKTKERIDAMKNELEEVGIRLGKRPPRVSIKKMSKGGITVNSLIDLKINKETIRSILNLYGTHNAAVTIREDIDEDTLVDVVAGNRVYIPFVGVINKVDLLDNREINEMGNKVKDGFVFISAKEGRGLDVLMETIYKKLGIVRVYLKPHGREADLSTPLILKKGSTIGDICDRLHRDMKKTFRYALVWGKSVRYDGQRKGLRHVLSDSDIVTIVTS